MASFELPHPKDADLTLKLTETSVRDLLGCQVETQKTFLSGAGRGVPCAFLGRLWVGGDFRHVRVFRGTAGVGACVEVERTL